MRILSLIAMLLSATVILAAADLTGTWKFQVELESGGRGEPTFELKQTGAKLTGTYRGPLGERPVTGTVTAKGAVFAFEAEQNGQKVKATYTATLDSPTRMTGTVAFSGDAQASGKWTAEKQ